MGVGNYSEEDIKESARAFTGWTFDRDGFVYRERVHDAGVKPSLDRPETWTGGALSTRSFVNR